MAKITLSSKIYDEVNKLEKGESFDVNKMVVRIYGDYDYFLRRSFDVMATHAKRKVNKELLADEQRDFKVIKGLFTRLN